MKIHHLLVSNLLAGYQQAKTNRLSRIVLDHIDH